MRSAKRPVPTVVFVNCRLFCVIVRGSKFAAYPCLKLSCDVYCTPLLFRAREKRGASEVVVHRHLHNLKFRLSATKSIVSVPWLLSNLPWYLYQPT